MVFGIDNSFSVRFSNWLKVRSFLEGVVSKINTNNVKVGLLQYGTEVKVEFDLQTYWSNAEYIEAVKFNTGITYISLIRNPDTNDISDPSFYLYGGLTYTSSFL